MPKSFAAEIFFAARANRFAGERAQAGAERKMRRNALPVAYRCLAQAHGPGMRQVMPTGESARSTAATGDADRGKRTAQGRTDPGRSRGGIVPLT